MILRTGIFLVASLWGVWTAVHLQCERQMEFSRGGLHQFNNQHSRGWPRIDAYTQHERQVMSPDSVFGNIHYDRTASNRWNYTALCFNLLVTSLLIAGIVFCLARICFDKSPVQFTLSTFLIIVTAVSVTIAVVLNEQQIYGFVFRDLADDFPFLSVRTLASVNLNQRAFVVLGVFSFLLQSMVYLVRFRRSGHCGDNAG